MKFSFCIFVFIKLQLNKMNNKSKNFSLRKRLQSFVYAFNGLKVLLREEHNARIHLGVSLLVIILGFIFDISSVEWLVVCILIGLVIAMEIVNSAIENLCDYVSPQWNEYIKKAKDLSAAAVLVCAIMSVVCGIIIFLPKIWMCISAQYSVLL